MTGAPDGGGGGDSTRGVALRARALRLRCPWCGTGPLFKGWLGMHRRCTGCGLRFEREEGYFLGSIYLNYGSAIVVGLVLHLLLQEVWHVPLAIGLPLVLVATVVSGLLGFRHARALWLAFDLRIDPPAEGEFQESSGGIAPPNG